MVIVHKETKDYVLLEFKDKMIVLEYKKYREHRYFKIFILVSLIFFIGTYYLTNTYGSTDSFTTAATSNQVAQASVAMRYFLLVITLVIGLFLIEFGPFIVLFFLLLNFINTIQIRRRKIYIKTDGIQFFHVYKNFRTRKTEFYLNQIKSVGVYRDTVGDFHMKTNTPLIELDYKSIEIYPGIYKEQDAKEIISGFELLMNIVKKRNSKGQTLKQSQNKNFQSEKIQKIQYDTNNSTKSGNTEHITSKEELVKSINLAFENKDTPSIINLVENLINNYNLSEKEAEEWQNYYNLLIE